MNADDIRYALRSHAETHRINPTLPPATARRARLGRFGVFAGTVVAAIAIAGGGFAFITAVSAPSNVIEPASGEPVPPASERVAAGGAPLLIVIEEGWRVSYADQYESGGEARFSHGEEKLELFWRPANTHEEYLDDRAASSEEPVEITIAGRDGVLFKTEGTIERTAMWLEGDLSLELRGAFETEDEFRAAASLLEYVDEETWLAKMPENVVKPYERAAQVEAMLADVPVPPSVDVEGLKTQPKVKERYQLGAEVTGAVTCAWIEQWIDAKNDGDAAAEREAVQAMASSPDWDILVEMNEQGGWSDVVWDHARAMKGDGIVVAGTTMTVEKSYRSAFGCSRFKG